MQLYHKFFPSSLFLVFMVIKSITLRKLYLWLRNDYDSTLVFEKREKTETKETNKEMPKYK